MKATGIVRRIDDLGRVVIPKEIRRTMRIHEGDPLEIFIDGGGEVIFKKYSPLGEMGAIVRDYADTLSYTSGHPVIVCDRDHIIHVAGVPKRELVERTISPELEQAIDSRKLFTDDIKPTDGLDYNVVCGSPIVSSGDIYGAIMMISKGDSVNAGEKEIALITTAAQFLGKQMEE